MSGRRHASPFASRSPQQSETLPIEAAIIHTYNCEEDKWTQRQTRVRQHRSIFNQGGMRVVHRLDEVEPQGFIIQCVVKYSTIHSPNEKNAYFRDAKTQMIADFYASMYNKLDTPEKVSFIASQVIEFIDRQSNKWGNIEPFLTGNYSKHNDNFGGVITGAQNPTPQVFSHFTFEASLHQLLICDIQGVGGVYTDPQIHSPAAGQFGDGDLGPNGIKRFFSTHTCNDLCRKIGLPENKPRVSAAQSAAMPVNMGPFGRGVPAPMMQYLAQAMGFQNLPEGGFVPGMSRILPAEERRRVFPVQPQIPVDRAHVQRLHAQEQDDLARAMELSRQEYQREQMEQYNRVQAEQRERERARQGRGRSSPMKLPQNRR